jgi:tetratricopeptide (TPR) repeat protein
MKFRNLAQAAAGIAFLALTSSAQITTIEGHVIGLDGKPVQNAEIQITRTDIKGSYKTKSDKKGHYIYMGLPIGFYNIACFMEGKQVDAMNGVKTSPGDPKPVDFDLRQSQAANAAKQAEMEKAVATGQLSKELERGLSSEQKAAMEKQLKERSEQMKKRSELNDSFNTGMTALNAKQYDQAIAAFVKASEVDPTQTAVWANLGEAYIKNAEGKTGDDFNGNIQKGLAAYEKAIELKPDDPASHNNYALALAKAKKFPEMQAELKKAADLDPANGGKYYYNLGALLVNSGQSEPAGDAFKKAIELTPTYADAYYQYGVTLVSQAKIGSDGKITPVPGTVDAFQKYLELAPTGTFADSAKEMLTTLGSSVETKFQNPNAKKEVPPPPKKTTRK